MLKIGPRSDKNVYLEFNSIISNFESLVLTKDIVRLTERKL